MQVDTVKLHIDQYRMMSTCPILLDGCEQLRYNDSILISNQDTVINDLQFSNNELTNQSIEDKEELKKRRKNVFKGT